ncbi:putative Pumilio 7 [Quillaja saponaria]|uniref:Pumilio 7 n=1 Tax=Quillaja saponaria TaxID=32244 RepID=A0AAD7PL21_QUISA|nr:putative Pumilio 7 [Quillaja saponaria]
MKMDRELHRRLNEIPNAPYLNLHHRHSQRFSPGSGVSLQSDCSSSSFCNGFYFSDDGSPYLVPLGDVKHQTLNDFYSKDLRLDSRFLGSPIENNINDDQGLSDNFSRMNMVDDQVHGTKTKEYNMDSKMCGFGHSSLPQTVPCTVEKYGHCEGFCCKGSSYEGVRSSSISVPPSSVNDIKWTALGSRKEHRIGNSEESFLYHDQSNASFSGSSWNKHQMYYLMGQGNEQGGSSYNGKAQLQNPYDFKPYLDDAFLRASLCGMDYSGDQCVMDPIRSSQSIPHKMALNLDNPLHDCSMIKERTRAMTNSRLPQFPIYQRVAGEPVAFRCDNSFILQGQNMKHALDKGFNSFRSCKKNFDNEIFIQNVREKNSRQEVQCDIYTMAKDHHGCRFLQRILDEGTRQDIQIIIEGIMDHVLELMMDQFGNYLVQKLLNICSEEQRRRIVFMVTKESGQLVKISLNAHGTRVVQKLVETTKSRKQLSLVKSALQPGFLDLIKDLNGNHVIQCCLQCLPCEDNEFIFDAAAKFCVDIATDRHGCCALQRCIDHAVGTYQDKLVTEICRNGLLLAQDPFGNYVIQHIIEMKIPTAVTKLIFQFKGNYVKLSMQKFSSHVVEKCLKHFQESRSRIVRELLSVSHFEHLLQDPYANYVIQSALAFTKGPLHALLVEAVRPHKILCASPYCKRIFSQNLLKK